MTFIIINPVKEHPRDHMTDLLFQVDVHQLREFISLTRDTFLSDDFAVDPCYGYIWGASTRRWNIWLTKQNQYRPEELKRILDSWAYHHGSAPLAYQTVKTRKDLEAVVRAEDLMWFITSRQLFNLSEIAEEETDEPLTLAHLEFLLRTRKIKLEDLPMDVRHVFELAKTIGGFVMTSDGVFVVTDV